MVLGAGLRGQSLHTDVADAMDQMTLILADAACRSVAGVTVKLGDRVIHNAAMTRGNRG